MKDKIAIIADIHGNALALEAVLNDIKQNEIETILNLGDIFYGPLHPKETYDLIIQNNVISILGNADRFLIENHKNPNCHSTIKYTLKSLPEIAMKWLKGLKSSTVYKNIFLCHGNIITDDSPLLEIFTEGKVILKDQSELENEVKNITQNIILCAHSHIPRLFQLTESKKTIINPGSVGCKLPLKPNCLKVEY